MKTLVIQAHTHPEKIAPFLNMCINKLKIICKQSDIDYVFLSGDEFTKHCHFDCKDLPPISQADIARLGAVKYYLTEGGYDYVYWVDCAELFIDNINLKPIKEFSFAEEIWYDYDKTLKISYKRGLSVANSLFYFSKSAYSMSILDIFMMLQKAQYESKNPYSRTAYGPNLITPIWKLMKFPLIRNHLVLSGTSIYHLKEEDNPEVLNDMVKVYNIDHVSSINLTATKLGAKVYKEYEITNNDFINVIKNLMNFTKNFNNYDSASA